MEQRMIEATCCVLGCSSSPLTRQTFHFFPPFQEKSSVPFKDESGDVTAVSRREAWIMLLRLNTINQKTRVCSKHFEDSEFQKTRRPTSTYSVINKNMLRTCALPTLHLPKPLNSGEQHYVIKDLEKGDFTGPTKSKKIILGVTAYVCCVTDCLHSNIGDDCKLFVIPNKPKSALAAWTEFECKFQEHIKDNSRVCSCHFIDGKLDGGPVFFPSDFEEALGLSKEKKKRYLFKLIPSTYDLWSIVSQFSENNSLTTVIKDELRNSSRESSVESNPPPSRTKLSKDDPELFSYLSGFKDYELFQTFLSTFDQDYIDVLTERKGSLPFCDQILSCLFKLRHNVSFSHVDKEFAILSGDAKGIFERCSAVIENGFCDGVLDNGKLKLAKTLWEELPDCNLIFFFVEVLFERDDGNDKSSDEVKSNKVIKNKSLIAVTPAGIISYVGHFFPEALPNEECIEKLQLGSIAKPGDIIFLDDTAVVLVKDIKDSRLVLTGPPFPLASLIHTHIMLHIAKITLDLMNYSIIKFLPAELSHLSLRIWRIVCAINNFKYADLNELNQFYLRVQGVAHSKKIKLQEQSPKYIQLVPES